MIASLLDVEVLADAGAERGDQCLDLLVGEDLVETGLLDIEDLASDRQDRLAVGLARADGRPAGGVAPTMKTSETAGSLAWQSRSLPGRPPDSSTRLRVASRALRAAIRAVAAWMALRTISLLPVGLRSSQAPNSLGHRPLDEAPTRSCRAWSWSVPRTAARRA